MGVKERKIVYWKIFHTFCFRWISIFEINFDSRESYREIIKTFLIKYRAPGHIVNIIPHSTTLPTILLSNMKHYVLICIVEIHLKRVWNVSTTYYRGVWRSHLFWHWYMKIIIVSKVRGKYLYFYWLLNSRYTWNTYI